MKLKAKDVKRLASSGFYDDKLYVPEKTEKEAKKEVNREIKQVLPYSPIVADSYMSKYKSNDELYDLSDDYKLASSRYTASKSNLANAMAEGKIGDISTYQKYYSDYMNAVDERKKELRKNSAMQNFTALMGGLNPLDDMTWDDAKRKMYKARMDTNEREKLRNDVYALKRAYTSTLLENNEIRNAVADYVKNNELVDDSVTPKPNEFELIFPSEKGNTNPTYRDVNTDKYKAAPERAVKAREKLEQMLGSDETIGDLVALYKETEANKINYENNQRMAEFADNAPVAASALSIAANAAPLANIASISSSAAQSAGALIKDEKFVTDNSNAAFRPSQYASVIRGTVADDIENSVESETAKYVLPLAYSAVMSRIDSLIASLSPGETGILLLGANKITSQLNDASNRGLDIRQGLPLAVWQGANEAFFERFSIGNFKGATGSIVKDALKSLGVEASEEAFTEIADIFADTVITKEQSNIAAKYGSAIKNGATEDEALKYVLSSTCKQVFDAAFSGMLAGGIAGPIGSAGASIKRNSLLSQAGYTLKNGDSSQIQNEIETGLRADKGSDAYKLASQLQWQLEKNSYDNQTEQFDYSIISDKKLGELRQKNTQSIFKQNVTELTSKEGNASDIAKVVDDIASGKKITKKQAEIISSSKSAVEAINSELGTQLTSDNISADVLTNISQSLAFGTNELEAIRQEQLTPTKDIQTEATKKPETQAKIKPVYTPQHNSNFDFSIPAVHSGTDVGINKSNPIVKSGNSVKISTSNGDIDYRDVEFKNIEQQKIVNAVAESDYIGETGVNTIFMNYTPQLADMLAKNSAANGVDTYITMATNLYKEGNSYGSSFESFLKKHPVFQTYADVLGKETAENIFTSGVTDLNKYNIHHQSIKDKRKGNNADTKKRTDKAGKYTNNTGREHELDTVFEAFADALGIDIVLDNNKSENGSINFDSKVMHLSANNSKELATLFHEGTHYIKLYNPKDFNTIANTILDWYKDTQGTDKYLGWRNSYRDAYNSYTNKGNTTADINEELVADAMAQICTSEQGIENFAEWLTTKSDKEQSTFTEAIRRFFEKLKNTLKSLVSRSDFNEYQKSFLQMQEQQLNDISKQWLSALDTAAANSKQKNNTATSDGVIKLSKKIDDPLNSYVQKVLNMSDEEAKQLKADDTYISIMLDTPKVILENIADAENLEVLMRFDSFYLETRKQGVLDGNYHNLGLQMAELPNYISKPDAIIRNDKGRLNLITSIDTNKNRLISIELNTVKDINTKYDKYNLVISVFNSKNRYVDNLIKKAVSLEYEREDLPQVNHQLHKSLAIINDKSSDTNVPQKDTDVNKNSMQGNEKKSLDVGSIKQEYEKAQRQTVALRNKISALKSSNEYHQMVSNISSSHGVALDTALSEYGNWLNTSGLNDAIRELDEVEKRNKQLRQKMADMKNAVDTPKSVEDLSDKEIAEYISKAEKQFGTTNNYKLAGYLTVNGKMLDFSEGQNRRTQDHREIRDVLDFIGDDANFSDGLIAFMNMGNIRLQEYGIDISKAPNEKQIAVLRDIFSKLNGEVKVDFSNEKGNNIDSVEYVMGTSAERIIRDIESFYKNGALSKPSAVSQFHTKYSIDVDYSYKTLISKPDMPITIVDDSETYTPDSKTRKDLINIALSNAKAVGYENEVGNPIIYVADIGQEILISKKAVQHSLDRRLNVNAPIVLKAGEILKNAVRINELSPRSDNIEKSYTLIGIAKNNQDEPYVVSFVVNKFTNELDSVDVLYSVNAKKEPTGSSKSPQLSRAATGSKISISDLLDYVNRYYPDILPEDVLKHYGYKSRPEGNLGESALYSLDVEKEIKTLRKQNEYLELANERMRQEFQLTHGRVTDEKAAKNLATHLLEERWSGIAMSKNELANELVELSNDGANGGYATYDDLYNRANAIAKRMLDMRKQALDPEAKEILDLIRKSKIRLSEAQKNEAAYYYDSYNNYRLSNIGSITVSNEGVPLDTQWQEWSELYPYVFDKNTNPLTQAVELANIVASLRDWTISEYGLDREGAEQTLTADIISAYFETPMKQTFADKVEKQRQQLRLDYRNAINLAKQEAKKNYDNTLKDVNLHYKDRIVKWGKAETERAVRTEMLNRQRQRIRDTNEKARLRKSIRSALNKIARMGANPTKDKHIPSSIFDTVKELAIAVSEIDPPHLTEKNPEPSVAKQRLMGYLDRFANSFVQIHGDKEYSIVYNMYNDYFSERINDLKQTAGNKTLSNLSVTDLRKINELVSGTVGTINNLNKLFKQDKTATIDGYVQDIADELSEYKKDKVLAHSPRALIYGSMKPEYFFQYLGSETMYKLYKGLENGEDDFASKIYAAKQYLTEIRKEHNVREWDSKKAYTYVTDRGEQLSFSLGQVLAVYANSTREQSRGHLLGGGITYEPKAKTRKEEALSKILEDNNHGAKKLSENDVAHIIGMLTNEQKAYVDEIVRYLSTEVAKWGNEVTRQLYDVDLFNETNYYPIMTNKQYIHFSSTDYKDSKKLVNSGFTKSTIEHSSQPIVLMEFDEVIARHIDDMAKYSAFALPLTDFDRVYHSNSKTADNEYTALQVSIANAFTNDANKYIDKLLEDINGNTIKTADTAIEKMISLFKKNAVMASLSVVVQQPSAVARTLSEINPKYFTKATISLRNNTKAYEQIKQYAPVAILKEIGSFDTGTSRGTVDYLAGKDDIKTKFNDVISYGAEKADQVTWVHIWNAVINETKAKNKGNSLTEEELLTLAGKRFGEVVKKTQVYDSVFSRSGLMRNKDAFSKMATAFMAEPTTSLNMAVNAVIQAKRGNISKSKAVMTMTSLVLASALNTMLKSLVYAMRDDDEDKKFIEKYFSQLPSNFIDEINPLNNIAIVRDIYSIIKGYDVERADMGCIGDVVDAFRKLNSDEAATAEKIEAVASSVSAMFGIPVKNVLRDTKAIINTIRGIKIDRDMSFSSEVTSQAILEDLQKSVVFDDALKTLCGVSVFEIKSNNEKLYNSIINNDKDMYNRLTEGKTDTQIDSAVKSGLIAFDKSIAEAGIKYAQSDISAMLDTAERLELSGFEYDTVIKAVKSYTSKMESAKDALDNNDTEAYNECLNALLESGVSRGKLETAIKTIEMDSGDSKTSQLFSEDDLSYALETGNQAYIDTITESMKSVFIANGSTEEEAEEKLAEKIKEARYGKAKTKSVLENIDDYRAAQQYVNEKIQMYMSNGRSRKQAVTYIKNSIASMYKDEYADGDADTRAKILTIMTNTGIYGDRDQARIYANQEWQK